MKTVELHFAIFSLRMERYTEMNCTSVTNFTPTIQGINPQVIMAGCLFAVEPLAARMSRARAAESHPDASQEAAREAREMFARAMQDARVRDDAAGVVSSEGDACTVPTREAHNG
jgi:hypothetical protein